MKTLKFVSLGIVWAVVLSSCGIPQKSISVPVTGMVQPGGRIGEMTVEQSSPTLPYLSLWDYCEPMPDSLEPNSSKVSCDVPQMSGITVSFGWLAREGHFLTNWRSMTWELSIDGVPVDVASYPWQEFAYLQHGDDNLERRWLIDLKTLTPGKHVLRLAWSSGIDVDNGIKVYKPGLYEHKVEFTVIEQAQYPVLSSEPKIGQHPFSSEQAGLDFLLYLPEDYGEEPTREWPLIVFLHGAYLRGAPIDRLKEEALPSELDNRGDLPFIVVSPVGDGGYEFWAQEEMSNRLLILLDQIQTAYPVNEKQVYLIGDGMGANGVWMLGLNKPEYFAALVPIGGYVGDPFEVPDNICALSDVPIWAFHGGKDAVVPVQVERDLVDAVNACGGNAQLTVQEDMTNNISCLVYRDPELYSWLLAQSK